MMNVSLKDKIDKELVDLINNKAKQLNKKYIAETILLLLAYLVKEKFPTDKIATDTRYTFEGACRSVCQEMNGGKKTYFPQSLEEEIVNIYSSDLMKDDEYAKKIDKLLSS